MTVKIQLSAIREQGCLTATQRPWRKQFGKHSC